MPCHCYLTSQFAALPDLCEAMGLFSKTFTPEDDLPDLKGKVIIVTGGK